MSSDRYIRAMKQAQEALKMGNTELAAAFLEAAIPSEMEQVPKGPLVLGRVMPESATVPKRPGVDPAERYEARGATIQYDVYRGKEMPLELWKVLIEMGWLKATPKVVSVMGMKPDNRPWTVADECQLHTEPEPEAPKEERFEIPVPACWQTLLDIEEFDLDSMEPGDRGPPIPLWHPKPFYDDQRLYVHELEDGLYARISLMSGQVNYYVIVDLTNHEREDLTDYIESHDLGEFSFDLDGRRIVLVLVP